jgi:hypothetical protein
MTKTIENINLETWFTERELAVNPEHFIKTSTPLTPEAKVWILERLHGRFSTHSKRRTALSFFEEFTPTFEDPKEAMFYELTWG